MSIRSPVVEFFKIEQDGEELPRAYTLDDVRDFCRRYSNPASLRVFRYEGIPGLHDHPQSPELKESYRWSVENDDLVHASSP